MVIVRRGAEGANVSGSKRLIIAIDGPVGSGKSTLARRVAALLGYVYIDTGAMYRSVALKAQRRGVPLDSGDRLHQAACCPLEPGAASPSAAS